MWVRNTTCQIRLQTSDFIPIAAVQHAHRALEIYRQAQVTETAQQHVRELSAVYTKTLTAK